MRKATRRLGPLSGSVATGSGVVAASYSTFSATTDSPADSWKSGTLALSDDDSGSALFAADPTQLTGVRCLKVTSSGSYSRALRLYSTAYSNPSALAEHINLKIDVGAASGVGAFADCSTFSSSSNLFDGKLATFGTTYTNYSTGKPVGWSTTAGSSDYRDFRFTWSYDDTAPQNVTATDTCTWEAQTS